MSTNQDTVMLEIQRALGRLEAQQKSNQEENIRKFDSLKDELVSHKRDNSASFGIVEAALSGLRTTNASMQTQDENTRLIGKWIIGGISSLALLVGSAVIAFLTNHIKFQ